MSNNLNPDQFKRTLYHSTGYYRPEEIDASGALKPSRQGESGPGVYLSADRSHAEKLSSGKPNRTTYEVEAEIRNPLVRHPDVTDDPGEREYRHIQTHTPGWHTKEGVAQQALQERGYDAVESHFKAGHEIAVHDPSKVRIVRKLP